MALGKTHKKVNLLIGLPIGLLLLNLANVKFQFYILFIFTFLVNTFLINPDLDVVHKKKWHFIFMPILYLFYPYSKVSKHRGLSHHVVWGTIIRFVYFGGIFFLIYPLIIYHPAIMIITLVTFYYADMIHLILDQSLNIKHLFLFLILSLIILSQFIDQDFFFLLQI